MTMELLVTGLGKERIILGFPWLQEQNPDINWKTGKFSWREMKIFKSSTMKGQEMQTYSPKTHD